MDKQKGIERNLHKYRKQCYTRDYFAVTGVALSVLFVLIVVFK